MPLHVLDQEAGSPVLQAVGPVAAVVTEHAFQLLTVGTSQLQSSFQLWRVVLTAGNGQEQGEEEEEFDSCLKSLRSSTVV